MSPLPGTHTHIPAILTWMLLVSFGHCDPWPLSSSDRFRWSWRCLGLGICCRYFLPSTTINVVGLQPSVMWSLTSFFTFCFSSGQEVVLLVPVLTVHRILENCLDSHMDNFSQTSVEMSLSKLTVKFSCGKSYCTSLSYGSASVCLPEYLYVSDNYNLLESNPYCCSNQVTASRYVCQQCDDLCDHFSWVLGKYIWRYPLS